MKPSLAPTPKKSRARRRSSAFRVLAGAACAAALVIPSGVASAQPDAQSPPSGQEELWWDTDPVAAARAEALLARMTLDQKVDMLHGELNNDYGFFNAAIPSLGIPALRMTDGRSGVRLANPAINNAESTLLPAAIGVAASWDPEASERHSQVATDETFRSGQNILLSPALNIARVPQNGRIFESYGEDPLLMGEMGSVYSQTTQDYGGVMSNVQDWAVYTQETNRLEGLNMVLSERALQEIYARPFGINIENAHPGSVMCGFNQVNGEYSCDSDYLLNQILKTQLEFEGFVLTDYAATTSTLGVNKGLDQEQPGNFNPVAGEAGTCNFCQPLIDAVNAGQVSIETINESVLRILRPMFGLGLFDRSYDVLPFPEAEHNEESAAIATEGMVLLKNDDDLLPLADDGGSIAVIGTDADVVVQGGGSSHIDNPTSETSPLAGIQARAGDAAEVTFTPGTDPVTSVALLPGAQPIPSSFLRPATGTGTGLTAEYFLNQDFSGTPFLNRVDPYAGLNGGFFIYTGFNASSPHFPPVPQAFDTNSSIRWSGSLVAPVTGTYELEVVTNGATTLTVDGTDVVTTQAWTPTADAPNQTVTVPLTFTAGSTHSISLSYVFDSSEAWNGGGQQIKLGWTPPEGVVLPQVTAAAEAAAAADTAVVVVRDFSTEAGDKPDLVLPNRQAELIRGVAEANPNTVVVMTVGGAVQVLDWQDAAGAVLNAWYPGQNQGTAIAEILFGDTNPSGKLPLTFPVDDEQTPTATQAQFPGINATVDIAEGIFEGYRGYLEYGIEPAYPFGYGLSYTSFDYSKLRVTCKDRGWDHKQELEGNEQTSETLDAPAAGSDAEADSTEAESRGWRPGPEHPGKDRSCKGKPQELSLWVTNTGDVAGSDVIQAYAGANPSAPVDMAEKSLAGWTKIYLQPGESQRVTINLDSQSFSYWDEAADSWVLPSGNVPVYVGSSVLDTPLEAVVKIRGNR